MKHFAFVGNGARTTTTNGNEYRIIPASNFFLASEEERKGERKKETFL